VLQEVAVVEPDVFHESELSFLFGDRLRRSQGNETEQVRCALFFHVVVL
jgi:hypothetical protein